MAQEPQADHQLSKGEDSDENQESGHGRKNAAGEIPPTVAGLTQVRKFLPYSVA